MFQFSGFNMMYAEGNYRDFHATYKCYSVSMKPGNERLDVEGGNKIIMPPSALETLTRMNISYPMLFKLMNKDKGRTSHAGVLEFTADEGICYMANWMMNNLLLDEGDMISMEYVSLPVASYSRFQAQSVEFLNITNPKAVLENALRNFACLTKGDMIAYTYNKRVYEMCVLETKPGNAVNIIECDMNVDFAPPVGYEDKCETRAAPAHADDSADEPSTRIEELVETFKGVGNRIDGKKKDEQESTPVIKRRLPRGVPDYDYVVGSLNFDRSIKPISDRVAKEAAGSASNEQSDDKFGSGQGFSIRRRQ